MEKIDQRVIIDADKRRVGEDGTTAGIVDQANRIIYREKPFLFIARDQVAFKGGVHTLDMTGGKQCMTDMRAADRAPGTRR